MALKQQSRQAVLHGLKTWTKQCCTGAEKLQGSSGMVLPRVEQPSPDRIAHSWLVLMKAILTTAGLNLGWSWLRRIVTPGDYEKA